MDYYPKYYDYSEVAQHSLINNYHRILEMIIDVVSMGSSKIKYGLWNHVMVIVKQKSGVFFLHKC